MHDAVEQIRREAAALREETLPGDAQAKITDRTASIMRASGGFRLLQAKDLGGFEAHPNDFFDWVMAVGEEQPSAGWIAGVVGVHPWEISIMHPRLQEEIYGQDPDTWTSSPYAPFGRATPVDGGFLFSGQWPFSTGTDYSDWVILGGMVVGEDGNPGMPPDIRHFVLPRGDYEIVEDSWNVLGLRGTGSKDVRMKDVFVPDYRVAEQVKMVDGSYARERRPDTPLYQMMFGLMFSAAIAAGTFGIARGAIRAFAEAMESRVSVQGNVARTDPFQLAALARADADVSASICHFQARVSELYDYVSAGNSITPTQRLHFRRDQVRAVDRCIEAVSELNRLAGSSAMNTGHPIERSWRDLVIAGTHVCNVREPIYLAWGFDRFGGEIPPATLF